jgi:hypothetical protein
LEVTLLAHFYCGGAFGELLLGKVVKGLLYLGDGGGDGTGGYVKWGYLGYL